MRLASRPKALQMKLPHQAVHRMGDEWDPPQYTPFASEIMEGVFLGSEQDALNEDQLSRRGISRVINTAKECQYETSRQVLKLGLLDKADAPIDTHFEETFEFIEEAREQNESVLIHCRRGISRSATIAIAYVMRKTGMDFHSAMDLVRKNRECINPNLGFILSLEQYQHEIQSDSEHSDRSSDGPHSPL